MAIRVPISIIPPSRQPFPLWSRLASVPTVAALTVVGVWAFGGKITDDFGLAMVLTAIWFGAIGLASLVVGLRWRPLALPVIATFLVVSTVIGAYLALSTLRDRVVDEQVATGQTLAQGAFEERAHDTAGTARVIERADGTRVIAFTEFETDSGPDLRVYLVPGDGEEVVDGFLDLGGLKGNVGNQQYELPPDVDPMGFGAVVVWCRAFSVNFGFATLAPPS